VDVAVRTDTTGGTAPAGGTAVGAVTLAAVLFAMLLFFVVSVGRSRRFVGVAIAAGTAAADVAATAVAAGTLAAASASRFRWYELRVAKTASAFAAFTLGIAPWSTRLLKVVQAGPEGVKHRIARRSIVRWTTANEITIVWGHITSFMATQMLASRSVAYTLNWGGFIFDEQTWSDSPFGKSS
jgi:hypothetical protein